MTTGEDEDILKEFLVESYENLDRLDQDFVAAETDPKNASARIASIFRTIHTIKGTSGFLGLPKLERLAHAGESLLSRLRDGDMQLDAEITSALLAMVDGVRAILAQLESSREEGEGTYTDLIVKLNELTVRGARPPSNPQKPLGEILVEHGAVSREQVVEAIVEQQGTNKKIGEVLVERGLHPEKVVEALHVQAERAPHAADTSVRVDVGLLDKLMNLVGELVLARNQILQFGGQSKDSAFVGTSQRLNLITTELQEGVMKTRMQPIGNIWNKFPRVVRDLSLQCKKQVALDMQGKDTDLDRTIIEAIKDPLTHLLRNSVDHGIESPEVRVAKGKSPTGRLTLRAFHEGGQVNIEITDDGAGLDPVKIRDKAIQRGIVTAERAARMTDRELSNLIFLPGFSTAEKVTSVSGRGVGMDVVKTNIEKIGGTVDLNSRPGQETSIRIKIPLTLAIIPALVVSSSSERFAIPQVSLLELVRLEKEQAKTLVEYIHGTPVYRLRGNLLPLVYLNDVLALPPTDNETVNIVVLQADDRPFGLVVDGVSDTEEIVVKPLGKELKGLEAFAGATIMGDGKVALILDVMGIAQRANVVSEAQKTRKTEAKDAIEQKGDDKQALLLFKVREDGRMAIPLSMVARLEEFDRERIERTGDQKVVQYRGEILPLIDLGEFLGTRRSVERAEGEALQVVVYSEHGRSVGLVVDNILDIVEESMSLKRKGSRRGVLGVAVVQGAVTDVVDVHGVIRATDPSFFDAA